MFAGPTEGRHQKTAFKEDLTEGRGWPWGHLGPARRGRRRPGRARPPVWPEPRGRGKTPRGDKSGERCVGAAWARAEPRVRWTAGGRSEEREVLSPPRGVAPRPRHPVLTVKCGRDGWSLPRGAGGQLGRAEAAKMAPLARGSAGLAETDG